MRKQGSKYQLANATPENAASAVAQARERGWTDAQLRKHGNAHVLAHIDSVEGKLIASMQQAVEKRKPARVTTVKVQQPAVAYSATQRPAEGKRRRQARAQRPVAEVLPLELVRNGVHYSAQVVVWPPRAKQRGPGLTHDAAVVLAGERHACTLSPTAVLRLQGGERVELYLPCEDGKAHGFVARKAEVQ